MPGFDAVPSHAAELLEDQLLVLGGDPARRGRRPRSRTWPLTRRRARPRPARRRGEYLTALSIRFVEHLPQPRARRRARREARAARSRDLDATRAAELGRRDRLVDEPGEVDLGERVAERARRRSARCRAPRRRAPRAGRSRRRSARGTRRAARASGRASAAASVRAEPITAAIGVRTSCETSETKSARSVESRRSSSTVCRSASCSRSASSARASARAPSSASRWTSQPTISAISTSSPVWNATSFQLNGRFR